jgi:ssDNA-binding Zn-finger/Zn-ribbon topoisomerase 1
MKEELKPCPFCGAIPLVEKSTYGRYFAMCPNEECLVHVATNTYYIKLESATAAWNKRIGNGDAMKEELKPCPFCGAIPLVKISTTGRYFVACHNKQCLAQVLTSTFYVKPESAIAAWNKRIGDGGAG